jgi:hypothetical protein
MTACVCTGVSASEQRCLGWSHASFGSPLAVVHTKAGAAVVCGSGNGSAGASGGVCVGLRGHTVWRNVVLHATAPVTAICSEVLGRIICVYEQCKDDS